MPCVGWREWVGLPELGITELRAKVDTGARTSSLHASDIQRFEGDDGRPRVRFTVPLRKRKKVTCVAPRVDQRTVTDSGGRDEVRLVIWTPVVVGERVWTVEINLTDRTGLRHPMLLGRTAVRGRFLVDPSRSYLRGKPVAGRAAESPRPAAKRAEGAVD